MAPPLTTPSLTLATDLFARHLPVAPDPAPPVVASVAMYTRMSPSRPSWDSAYTTSVEAVQVGGASSGGGLHAQR